MAAIDKAAIAWTIAIVAFAAGIAGLGGNLQDSSVVETASITEDVTMMEDESMMMEEESMMEESVMMEEGVMIEEGLAEETMMEEEATTYRATVTIPTGTSVPGCEATDECYLPASIAVNAGGTVIWDNVDSVAHTVTSGTLESGPTGLFDSSLLLGGNAFEVTFDSAGSYDYFCLVHPWMVGSVQVS